MSKVFNDPIHGSMRLPGVCVKIIDTPEFQRLRHIKQLTAESVYPSATHNRFSHSIGVCHLAGKVINHLRSQPDQPLQSEDITDDDVKCIQIAGLCHDLGHGPLSHKFESVVNRLLPKGQKWKHEDASVEMLRYLNENNNIGLSDDEIDFIIDLISGKPPKNESARWEKYKTKRFLYQIVANKETGMDVDKWDYFARDCHHLGIGNSFDHGRIITNCMRVVNCQEEDTKEICFRDKLIFDLSEMFKVRWELHYRAYQHKVVKLIEEMQSEVLWEFFDNDAKKESPTFGPMKKIIQDMSIYKKVDDRILGVIEMSDERGLAKAREIMERIHKRDLYQFIGELKDADNKNITPKKTMFEDTKEECLTAENLVIIEHKYDYGKKEHNPLKFIRFYRKDDDSKAVLLGDEEMPPNLPARIQWRDVRLYTRYNKFSSKDEIQRIKNLVKQKINEQINKQTPITQKRPAEDTPRGGGKRHAGSSEDQVNRKLKL